MILEFVELSVRAAEQIFEANQGPEKLAYAKELVKEALFLHTKVITTDVVGPREILLDGKYGLSIPNNDEDIKYAMEDVMKNKEKYKYLEENIKSYHGDNDMIKEKTMKLLDL